MSTDKSKRLAFRVVVCCALILAALLYPSVARYIFNKTTRYKVFNTAAFGTVEDVKYFIERGVSVNDKTVNVMSLLHCAAMNNTDIDVMKYLIEQGADVNAKDDYGRTPLHYAADTDSYNIETLEYLIDNGVDVNAKDNDGETPLDYAIDFAIRYTGNRNIFKEKEPILRKAGGKRGEELPE